MSAPATQQTNLLMQSIFPLLAENRSKLIVNLAHAIRSSLIQNASSLHCQMLMLHFNPAGILLSGFGSTSLIPNVPLAASMTLSTTDTLAL